MKGIGEIKKRRISVWIDRNLTKKEAKIFFDQHLKVDVVQCPTGLFRRAEVL